MKCDYMDKLGKFLVKQYLLTDYELNYVLEMQSRTSSSIEDIILSEGYINPYKLYSAIAGFHGLEFADLKNNPCNKNLSVADDRDVYTKFKVIPWKMEKDTVIIAACRISDEITNWAKSKYGKVKFVITTPFDINQAISDLFADENSSDAKEKLWRLHPYYSAKNLFKNRQSKIFVTAILLLLLTILMYPKHSLIVAFFIMGFFYTSTLLFKTILFVIGMARSKKTSSNDQERGIADKNLPVYTILVPLYKEERVLKKLTNAIKSLDYPKSKLDVKLIVEADDELTINAIKALKCERFFEIVKVPYSIPRTKPKACNYALRFAKGKYVTIYDAEDIPDPQQLRKVLHTFHNSPEDVVCIQAKLNFFNWNESLLARMFAIEYSTLFDFMLFGLEAMKIPIPLGGTSNHFRVETLNKLYAWDAYNVTEDADLGIRIAQKGWRCKVIDSLTQEECPIELGAWIRQRSRWIKGHMQTYFVHMRQPLALYNKVGAIGFFGIQFFLGVPALIFLISPFMWSLWVLFITGFIDMPDFMPTWFDKIVYFSLMIFIIGILLQIFYAVMAIKHRKWPGMMLYSLVFPFYWVLHSIASFKALWQLITKPYYWEKTNHGVTSCESTP